MSTSELANLGVPDVETLAQLANQFFSALPGQAPDLNSVGAGLPPGLSHLGSPQAPHPFAVANVVGSQPSRGVNTGIPPTTSVPNATLSELPGGVPASVPVGQLPYLTGAAPNEGVQHPSPAVTPTPTVPTSFSGDVPLTPAANPAGNTHGLQPALTLNPLDWGLPSDAELADLLALRSPARGPSTEHALAAPGPSFYFLDHVPLGQPGLLTPGLPHQAEVAKPQGFKPPFDVNLIRQDFPILRERVNGRPLIWLDNAATTQKPQCVIDRVSYFYEHENSNIHRAAHELAARATDAYEGARETTRAFLNACSVNEIVFVRGTTEAINLVAKSWGRANLREGDEIMVSHLEHHANIVPWQQLCAFTGAKLRVIPVDDDGQILLDEYAKLLGPRTKLVSFTQVSNALGTITPAKQMVAMAHSAGAKVLVDGAQSVSHMRSDVVDLDCDWFVFSGHKIFGPTGIGALYGKEALLNETPPWQGGGNMIKDVTFEHTEYHAAPGRFEAGTGNIADAAGMGAALAYVMQLGIDNIGAYEHQLLVYATRLLKDVPGLRLIGTATSKASVMSFTLQGFKTEEVGAALNKEGIAVRSGHHCAQPILRRFGLEATVRPSLAFYNTCAEVDTLVATLHKLSGSQRRVY
ncbi:MAG: SufS family cysteine desulfurase [Aquabacterium sp.]|uniref:family 2A encapsulin nanocompartment cargo protein cysteine desulfurase n=1 Tax=Aquabacterium sp. TaxID=1872578 RepID=UPI00121CF353|nr:family 2A encapsulin nanocompartment cargo protein cysteine desulfurase [Aquabacterium sp.]TAK99176.1 MAG: SufS family cysteine desulfurase [Aquabacterium sp.]